MRGVVAAALALSIAVGGPALALAQEHGDHEGVPVEGSHAEAAHDEGHGAHGAHDTSIDWTLMGASILNFGIWLALILWMLRTPVAEFLRNRRASVVDGMEEAKRVKDEAESKFKEYSERIDNLDAELDRLREEMRRAGMEERDRIVAEAARKAEKMRAEARFLIEQQMKQLREDLTREAIEASVRTAGEMLAKQTTPQDQERLANDYLGTLRTALEEKIREKRL